MFTRLILILIFGFVSLAYAFAEEYRGSKIYQLDIPSTLSNEIVSKLELGEEKSYFDILKVSRIKGEFVQVMVHQTGEVPFRKMVEKFKLEVKLLDRDVERSVIRAQVQNFQVKVRTRHRRSTGRQRYSAYLTFSEMESYLKGYADHFEFVNLEEFGKSFENRSMWLLKISKNVSLPIIWIDAGIHAREWIAPATAFYLIENFLTINGDKMLKRYQFYIAPNINPDGYEFSFRSSRYWRKNRARFSISQCEGVDLNRNFPYKWGVGGASSSPCSDTYMGGSRGDQPETKAIVNKLESIKDTVKLYLTLHSYGQYIMTPFGYQQGYYPATYQKLMEMAIKAIYKIWNRYGSVYTAGSAADLLYAAAGGSDDFACGTLEIPFSYTIELPDQGSYNFLIPPAYIPLVGKEIWTALTVFTEEM